MVKKQSLEHAINLMELEFYRVKRYKTPICIAIIESECTDLFNNIIKNTIRFSDLYQYLDSNHFFVIFDHTKIDGAKKALEKIFKNMEAVCDKEIYAGFTEVDKTDNESLDTIKRALNALKSAKQVQNENIVSL